MRLVRALLLIPLLIVATLVTARPADAGSGTAVHVCQQSDSTTTGVNVVVCEDGLVYPFGGYLDYALDTEFICRVGLVVIQCRGIYAHSQEYVGSWQQWHLLVCGTWQPSVPCATGRQYDRNVPSIARPPGCWRWIGRIFSTTVNARGALFTFTDYRGMDVTACPSKAA